MFQTISTINPCGMHWMKTPDCSVPVLRYAVKLAADLNVATGVYGFMLEHFSITLKEET